MVRRFVQVQLFLERSHNPRNMPRRVLDLDLLELFEAVKAAVALRKFEQTKLIATLRHTERSSLEQLFSR